MRWDVELRPGSSVQLMENRASQFFCVFLRGRWEKGALSEEELRQLSDEDLERLERLLDRGQVDGLPALAHGGDGTLPEWYPAEEVSSLPVFEAVRVILATHQRMIEGVEAELREITSPRSGTRKP
jgi:hypothetical protein